MSTRVEYVSNQFDVLPKKDVAPHVIPLEVVDAIHSSNVVASSSLKNWSFIPADESELVVTPHPKIAKTCTDAAKDIDDDMNNDHENALDVVHEDDDVSTSSTDPLLEHGSAHASHLVIHIAKLAG